MKATIWIQASAHSCRAYHTIGGVIMGLVLFWDQESLVLFLCSPHHKIDLISLRSSMKCSHNAENCVTTHPKIGALYSTKYYINFLVGVYKSERALISSLPTISSAVGPHLNQCCLPRHESGQWVVEAEFKFNYCAQLLGAPQSAVWTFSLIVE